MTQSTASRPRPRSALLFAALALALSLLLGHWSAAKQRFPALFQAHATPILAAATGRPVRLGAPERAAPGEVDTVLRGYAQGVIRPVWTSRFSLVRIGYWPCAVLVAMILATPMTPRRRALALLGGLALLDAVTLGRIGIEIAYAYQEFEHGPGQALRGPLHLLLRVGSESLTATIPSGAAVFGIWVLVSDPRRGLDLGGVRVLLGFAPAPAPPGAPETQSDASQDPPGAA
ncbi:MAG: hypothetical protein OEY15_10770 [Myxococcales bacterium]|nr:hypothetical protein [Myxococcales bacterium]